MLATSAEGRSHTHVNKAASSPAVQVSNVDLADLL